MSGAVSTHHLFAFGHNPFQKLGPLQSPSSDKSVVQGPSSILSAPTDVLPHLTSSCDHIIRSSLRSSGSTDPSVIGGDVEIKAEFVWGCYSSSLVKVRWSWLTTGHEDKTAREADHNQIPINLSSRSGRPDDPQTRATKGKARGGKAANPTISRIDESCAAGAERTDYQAKRRRHEAYQYVLLGYPPDDIDPDLLVRKEQGDKVRSVAAGTAYADDGWTTLLNLPKDIKIIGFDQMDAFLDLTTGSISPIGRSRPGPSGDVIDMSDILRENRPLDRDIPEKWQDAATLTDGTVYLVPTIQDHESGHVGIWEFGNVDSLLRSHRGGATNCRFIPVAVASIHSVSAATSSQSASQPVMTLHPGHSHLLIHCPRPYAQTFGLGDNRFLSACPAVSTTTGSLRTPREVDTLTAVPLTWIGGGDRTSGAISEAGEAWMWGKGVGQGLLQNVSFVGHDEVDVKLMAVAEDYALVITEDNRVWTRGQNDWGQLGCPPSRSLERFLSSPQTQGSSEWKAMPFFEKDRWKIERLSAKSWSTWISCTKGIRERSCLDDNE